MELFSSPNRTGSDWSLALFPTLLHADVISRKVKRYAAEEIRGVFWCGIGQQLDYYLWVQTILKADTDYEEVVSEVLSTTSAQPQFRCNGSISASQPPIRNFLAKIGTIELMKMLERDTRNQ